MIRYVARRLAGAALVLLVMSLVIYALIGLMPGDPVDLMAASVPNLTPAQIANLRHVYGLDQPLPLRYWHWLLAALGGDLGASRLHHAPVLAVLLPALAETARLMLAAFGLAVALATGLGVAAAVRPGGVRDTAISLFAFAGISVPVFWLALVLILVFAVRLHWLPASGAGEGGGLDRLRHLVLPVATLALAIAGQFIRFVRASVIETLRLDHIRTARAKGAGEGRVLWAHVLRNAMIPVVTVMALSFGGLFSGALITETMFARPGMGRTIYDAVQNNDYNLALGGLLLATLVTLLSNLAADLAYAWLDPRIDLV